MRIPKMKWPRNKKAVFINRTEHSIVDGLILGNNEINVLLCSGVISRLNGKKPPEHVCGIPLL